MWLFGKKYMRKFARRKSFYFLFPLLLLKKNRILRMKIEKLEVEKRRWMDACSSSSFSVCVRGASFERVAVWWRLLRCCWRRRPKMQHCAEFFATLSAQKCKAICSSSQARIVGDLQYAMKLQCKFQNSISKTPDFGAQSTYEDFLRKTKRRFTRIQCQTFRHQARCKNPALTYLNHRENICRPIKRDSVAVMLGAWCCSKN